MVAEPVSPLTSVPKYSRVLEHYYFTHTKRFEHSKLHRVISSLQYFLYRTRVSNSALLEDSVVINFVEIVCLPGYLYVSCAKNVATHSE